VDTSPAGIQSSQCSSLSLLTLCHGHGLRQASRPMLSPYRTSRAARAGEISVDAHHPEGRQEAVHHLFSPPLLSYISRVRVGITCAEQRKISKMSYFVQNSLALL